MSLGEDLSRRVRDVSREVRTALAAECGSRVLPVYEEYWVGTYADSIPRSVEIAWAYACGTPFDRAEVQGCLIEVTDVVAFYREEGNDILSNATTVVLRVLQCLDSDDDESLRAVGRAMVSVLNTAQSAESMANRGTPTEPKKKFAVAEEEAWQDRAVTIARGWTGGVAQRTMFDAAGAKPPAWLLDWLKRSKR
jgi:hypothetical protein